MNQEKSLYVAADGHDDYSGSKEFPFATLHRAKAAVRERIERGLSDAITVYVRQGTYYFTEPLVFEEADSGTCEDPVEYCAFPGEKVTLSGARRLQGLQWEPYKDGIVKCNLPKMESDFDQFYVNGNKQIRARYPNIAPDYPLMDGGGYLQAVGGTDHRPDTELIYDPNTFTTKQWQKPNTGIVHVFQSHYWGNMQYHIQGVDKKNHKIHLGKGGFQLQRRYGINHRSRFYVENILEELDEPSEWFLDHAAGVLYYYPEAGIDMETALVETVRLKQLIEFRGSSARPVSNVKLSGFTVKHTCTTFLDQYEDLSRGDWAIHRGGAIFIEGASNCTIQDFYFDTVGGNGVFINGYNRSITVADSKFDRCGESAVCVVGSSSAVRMYQTWATMESGEVPPSDDGHGPKTPDYPKECIIHNNIIHNIGIYGKQTAGVLISMSQRITVSHNTIYEVPRAAICINDGTWGGHVIEHNDIWETVRETGEHGPFNAWGRDRGWGDPAQEGSDQGKGMNVSDMLKDAVEINTIRHNRIVNMRKSVSAGNWTIDLDDGSSHYHIYNNLCLGSTLKLRDGFYRKVENNIFVSPVPLGWHVWPEESEDIFMRNIVVVSGCRPGEEQPTTAMISPIRMPRHPWGRKIDENLYWNVNTKGFIAMERAPDRLYDLDEWRSYGYDIHSRFADPLFINPIEGDYRLRADSPAVELGIQPISLSHFGHKQTRIYPFGGEFEQTVTITMEADIRGGDIWYTTDGSEPCPNKNTSMRYLQPIRFDDDVRIKACTFRDDLPQGFVQEAEFMKVEHVERPDWLEQLVRGTQESDESAPSSIQIEQSEQTVEWYGARLSNISDGDLIDALGGYQDGVIVLYASQPARSYEWGLRTSDVIIEWDGVTVRTLADLQDKLYEPLRNFMEITILRNYKKKKLSIHREYGT